MKQNIVIVGLNYKYNLMIGKILANNFNMYFLDALEYVNYSLFSRNDMLEKCGIEYLNNQENKAIKSCSEFENSVICIPCDLFLRNQNFEKFKTTSNIVYLYFSQERLTNLINDSNDNNIAKVDLLVFEDRNNDLQKICDIMIKISNKKSQTIVKEIDRTLRSM